jgi:hypothetical protein
LDYSRIPYRNALPSDEPSTPKRSPSNPGSLKPFPLKPFPLKSFPLKPRDRQKGRWQAGATSPTTTSSLLAPAQAILQRLAS